MENKMGASPLAKLLGDDLEIPVFDGRTSRYVNLDNAATTPPFQKVWDKLAQIMPWYGSVHRGAGYKSVVSTRILEESLTQILQFCDGDPSLDMLILGWNTTSCLNHLARRLGLSNDSIVVTSEVEHSSNILPWRKHATVIECSTSQEGDVDLDHLEKILRENKISLVAVTGASNITGAIPDTYSIARLAHRYGAKILVDAAQLVAHRPIRRNPVDSPEHLDFVVFAGHKMYAPFGLGVLVGSKETFNSGFPDVVGGGTIRLIDGEEIIWSDLPDRESGGTPNFPGVFALSEACKVLLEIGFDKIMDHERALICSLREHFASFNEIISHRSLNSSRESAAIFPFSVEGHNHSLIAAFLGIERGIGVRAGHLCQFALMRRFLKISEQERVRIREKIRAGDKRELYGVVRASCGLGTTVSDILALKIGLQIFLEEGPKAAYIQTLDGDFHVTDWNTPLPSTFEYYSAGRKDSLYTT